MKDYLDEEDLYQEELDLYDTDDLYEQHDAYDDFELEELSFWDSFPDEMVSITDITDITEDEYGDR